MADGDIDATEPLVETLTRREMEILSLLADRLSDREIAERLILALSSVKWYARRIYAKLGVDNRRSAVKRARDLGLFEGGDVRFGSQPKKHLEPRHHRPAQLPSFIGRKNEIQAIQSLLLNPDCRLVTLTGPGGIGKSWLALHLQQLLQDKFAHGVRFVPLEALPNAHSFAAALADALDLPLRGQAEPHIQLLNHLREVKLEMLLVLDNFEHLTDGTPLLIDILETAPALKLLVTSRETLNVRLEWLYAVQGLAYPEPTPSQPSKREMELELALDYPAVQLFIDHARRVRSDFTAAGQLTDLIGVCQLVEGMPLAIQMAAAWTRTLSCSEIADEIKRNLDFLATRLRDVPERHRSMRAVFDHSWRLLDETEREVVKKVSVFRGGFRRQAAERVAGASLVMLASLIDNSLLQSEPGDHYHMHELLRQFAAERLAESSEDAVRVHDAHCAYYADYLYERRGAVTFSAVSHRQAVADIQAELGNIRAAWQWAVNRARADDILKSAYTLHLFLDNQGQYLEGVEAFDQAARQLNGLFPEHRLALADVLAFQGWLYLRLGQYAIARDAAQRSRLIFNELNVPPKITTDPLGLLGVLALVSGDFAEAERWGEESRRINEARRDTGNLILSLYILASAAFGQGHYEAAQRFAQQAYTLAQEIHFEWFTAYILIELGNIASALDNNADAQKHFEASYAIRQAFDDHEGMAAALNQLGKIAVRRRNFIEAKRLYGQSLVIYRQIGDRGGLAAALKGLGDAECALGDLSTARTHFLEGLQIAAEIGFTPLLLASLVGVGEFLIRMGASDRAVQVLAFVEQHPASERETRELAQGQLAQCEKVMAPTPYKAVRQRSDYTDLTSVVENVLADLANADFATLELRPTPNPTLST